MKSWPVGSSASRNVLNRSTSLAAANQPRIFLPMASNAQSLTSLGML